MPLICYNTDVEKYLAEVRAQADKLGLREKLEARLTYLEHYGCSDDKPDNARVTLFKDSAPLSFGFNIEFKQKDGTYRDFMNGGLIFHGKHDGYGSGGAPTFAVTVTAVDDDWSVHT